MSRIKYRPYFSPEELIEILSALQENPTPQRLNLIKSLKKYKLKIDEGLIEASYIHKPRLTQEQKLGFSETPQEITKKSFEELKQQSYTKSQNNLTQCTSRELELAALYRYENDLMSPEEEDHFEASGIQDRLADHYLDRRKSS